ncbi:hypothetical protein [Anaerostipes hominis (ex Lee et al. 2021)]|uniref:hypothetical protein n=1 Tax=Anaerostipes hominis (ex Lee et al. 2021) TaxID=2025494 RepID=UPI0034B0F4C3
MRKMHEKLYLRLRKKGISEDKLLYFKDLKNSIDELECMAHIFVNCDLSIDDSIKFFERVNKLSYHSVNQRKTVISCLMTVKDKKEVKKRLWKLFEGPLYLPLSCLYEVLCFFQREDDMQGTLQILERLPYHGEDAERILTSIVSFLYDPCDEKIADSEVEHVKKYLIYVARTGKPADERISKRDILEFMKAHKTDKWHLWESSKKFYDFLQKENPFLKELDELFHDRTRLSTIPEKEIRQDYPMEAKDQYVIMKNNIQASFLVRRQSAEVNFYAYKGICVRAGKTLQREEKIVGYFMKSKFKILFFFSNAGVYYEAINGKLYPFSIQNLCTIQKVYGELKEVFVGIFSALCHSGGFGRCVANMISDASEPWILKMELSDAVRYRSFEHYFVENYNGALVLKEKLPEGDSINRHHPEYFYMLLKVRNKIQDKELMKLLSFKEKRIEEQIVTEYKLRLQQNTIEEMLCSIFLGVNPWTKRVGGMSATFFDICQRAKIVHKKIRIFYPGRKSLFDEADYLENQIQCRRMGVIKIPRDSVFQKLEKFLPENFMRIRTRKALREICLLYRGIAKDGHDGKINQDKEALFWKPPFLYSFIEKDGAYQLDALYEKGIQIKKSTLKFQKILEEIQLYIEKGVEIL